MKTKLTVKAALILSAGICCASVQAPNARNLNDRILESVKKATDYMVNTVSCNGGFVWEYLPDLSRRWGEMEAYPTMAWTQGPGTPAMGHFFLDLYHATGDEYYYRAAEKTASALIAGQLPCGGWNYVIDFAGEPSIRRWYETIGRNGWRLEEFHHYYGNATYDDDATAGSARFLLRIYVEKYDPKFKPALDKAIDFVLESQYPIGGWPQRYPLMYEYSKGGRPDYSSFITFNDNVHRNNIDFLVMCYRLSGEKRFTDPILRAMNCVIALQQGPDQPGWSDQYTLDYRPSGARSYEPRAIHTRTTQWCLNYLMDFYEWTGDSKFLARIPETLAWLKKIEAPADSVAMRNNRRPPEGTVVVPRNPEIGTDRPLSSRRAGSNAVNGRYHTRQAYGTDFIAIDIESIRRRYEELKAMPVGEATRNSPFRSEGGVRFRLPEYVAMRRIPVTEGDVRELLSSLTADGYWLAPMSMTSNPYIEGGTPETVTPGDFSEHYSVGDSHDTSPYTPTVETPGITTRSYMTNVSRLMSYINKNLPDNEN